MTFPTAEQDWAEGAPAERPPATRPPLLTRKPWLLAAIGIVLVAAAIALQTAGIVQAGVGNWERGTLLAWLAIGVSVAAFTLGVLTVMRKRAWRLGLFVMVAGLLANPYLLTKLLALFG